jgi:hypothetical protein
MRKKSRSKSRPRKKKYIRKKSRSRSRRRKYSRSPRRKVIRFVRPPRPPKCQLAVETMWGKTVDRVRIKDLNFAIQYIVKNEFEKVVCEDLYENIIKRYIFDT